MEIEFPPSGTRVVPTRAWGLCQRMHSVDLLTEGNVRTWLTMRWKRGRIRRRREIQLTHPT